MNTLEIIKEHGLLIRQIPKSVTGCIELRHYEENNPNHEIIRPEGFNRDMVKTTKYPEKGGYWMCKEFRSTSSRVEWSYKKDFLAPTLEKSIQLYLDSIKGQNE